MGDWQLLRAHVVARYEVHADERTMYDVPGWDALSVIVRTAAHPRLVVIGRRREDGVEWLEVAAVVADAADADASGCLRWNGRNVVGALFVNDDALMFKRTFPLAALDIASLDAAIEGVAHTASGLKEALVHYGSL
jgi:hypothetical protein